MVPFNPETQRQYHYLVRRFRCVNNDWLSLLGYTRRFFSSSFSGWSQRHFLPRHTNTHFIFDGNKSALSRIIPRYIHWHQRCPLTYCSHSMWRHVHSTCKRPIYLKCISQLRSVMQGAKKMHAVRPDSLLGNSPWLSVSRCHRWIQNGNEKWTKLNGFFCDGELETAAPVSALYPSFLWIGFPRKRLGIFRKPHWRCSPKHSHSGALKSHRQP